MIRVAIIGGGAAGLVTLKTLLENATAEEPIEAILFEAEDSIGGTFRYRAYENSELVSSKQLTCFSDFRLPLDAPTHVSLPRYVEYLGNYCDEFNLWPHIKLGHRVTNIAPTDKGDWPHRVTYRPSAATDAARTGGEAGAGEDAVTEEFECSHIAICTGLHVEPSIPHIPGIEHFKGETLHSSQYKKASQLSGRKVLILGCGETAMDIAYEAVQAGATAVTMCFRQGFLAFPKQLGSFKVFGNVFHSDLPVDTQVSNLFDNTYVHPIMDAWRVRSIIRRLFVRPILWFVTGSSYGWNQFVGLLPPEKARDTVSFFNKSSRAMPYLNRVWKKPGVFHRLVGNGCVDPPETGAKRKVVDHIDTCTFPSRITENGEVLFTPNPDRKDYVRMSTAGSPFTPDLIVYCTGYRHSFGWLDESYPRAWDADCRDIVSYDRPDVAYIGFTRPNIGAIPPIAEMQAMWWTSVILNRMPLTRDPTHYHLIVPDTARIKHGVDFTTYMATLAKDFGGLPSLPSLYWQYGWSVLVIYCLGTTFVSFYRLLGPFRSQRVVEVVEGELMDVVRKKGTGYILIVSIIPMIFFGVLNLLSLVLYPIVSAPSNLLSLF